MIHQSTAGHVTYAYANYLAHSSRIFHLHVTSTHNSASEMASIRVKNILKKDQSENRITQAQTPSALHSSSLQFRSTIDYHCLFPLTRVAKTIKKSDFNTRESQCGETPCRKSLLGLWCTTQVHKCKIMVILPAGFSALFMFSSWGSVTDFSASVL